MTIKLHLNELPITNVAYSYSVLNELLLSLKVLGNHKHYPLHIGWALATRRQLTDEMRREHRFFRVVFQMMLTFLWETGQVEEADFAIELELFEKRPLSHFTNAIISALLIGGAPTGKRVMHQFTSLDAFQQDLSLQKEAQEWLTHYYPESRDLVDLLLSDPASLKQRFIVLIKNYWALIFQATWLEIEPYFLQEISQRGQRLYLDGVITGLADLMPKMHLNKAKGEILFYSEKEDEEKKLGHQDTLQLYPSYFTYPGAIFSFHWDEINRLTVSITYPLSEIRNAGISPLLPEQLLTTLRAVGDRTRLQILQLVAKSPRSTREIAPIIGVSGSGRFQTSQTAPSGRLGHNRTK